MAIDTAASSWQQPASNHRKRPILSHTPVSAPRTALAIWLGIAAALTLGLGFSAPFAPLLALNFDMAGAAFLVPTVLYVISIGLVVVTLVLSPALKKVRLFGAVFAAVGYGLGILIFIASSATGNAYIPRAAGVIVVAVVVSGLLLALGAEGRGFVWLLLLLIPLLGTHFLAFGAGGLLIAQILTALVSALVVGLAALSVWRAPALAARRNARAEEQEQAQLEQRAVEIRKWEEAYALAHGGERPPAGFMPPATTATVGAAPGRTNTLATLALIFAIIGSVVGLILGYVARAQIRRTGENGAGMALAAIIIGWIEVGLFVIVAIIYIAVFASVLG